MRKAVTAYAVKDENGNLAAIFVKRAEANHYLWNVLMEKGEIITTAVSAIH